MSAQPPWEEIEHTADLALRACGEDLRALFQNAALGMLSLVGGDISSDEIIREHIELSAPDWEMLLYDWLGTLLHHIEDRSMVCTNVAVHRVQDLSLSAEVTGSPGYHFAKHIKAVTFHDLAIRQSKGGYEATIVFDV